MAPSIKFAVSVGRKDVASILSLALVPSVWGSSALLPPNAACLDVVSVYRLASLDAVRMTVRLLKHVVPKVSGRGTRVEAAPGLAGVEFGASKCWPWDVPLLRWTMN